MALAGFYFASLSYHFQIEGYLLQNLPPVCQIKNCPQKDVLCPISSRSKVALGFGIEEWEWERRQRKYRCNDQDGLDL